MTDLNITEISELAERFIDVEFPREKGLWKWYETASPAAVTEMLTELREQTEHALDLQDRLIVAGESLAALRTELEEMRAAAIYATDRLAAVEGTLHGCEEIIDRTRAVLDAADDRGADVVPIVLMHDLLGAPR